MSIAKTADAFRTISEAAIELDVPQHVLRHWEEVFGQIRPMRRAGGRRYYRPADLDVLRGVRVLLYDVRYTTKGVQKIFRDKGVRYIAELGRMAAAGQPIELGPLPPDDQEDSAHAPAEIAPSAVDGGEGVTLPSDVRARLVAMLQRLERAQASLDDAIVAIEAIDIRSDNR
jgi:DNA-binding transcriptional MerR regulator